MPSINHYIPLTKHTRIRLNTCEGENHICREVRNVDTGKWCAVECVKLDDAAAVSLAHKITQVFGQRVSAPADAGDVGAKRCR